MNKDQAIGLMIQLEGGYANVAGDPGGCTKYGITQATLTVFLSSRLHEFDTWPHDVKDIIPAQAAAIYGAVDWEAIHGDDLPSTLAPLVLNSAVNMGEPTAVRLLQECLGMQMDGVLGPHTLAAIDSWRSSYLPGQTLAEEFAAHVGVKYASLYAREGQFELGWLRRLFRVYTLAVSS
jgi:lysozyme family protein